MPTDSPPQPRACKCLNVRITPGAQAPSSAPPRTASDPIYTPLYVDDDGIAVTHTQVTVRLLSKPEPIPGSTKHTRYTTLTCLFCDLPVYRVQHEVSLDVGGNDTTLFPSESWLEREVLKSATGWIEVHKDCIVGDKISEAQASSSYAPSFSIIMPAPSSPLSTPVERTLEDEEELFPKRQPPDEPPRDFLSDMRPLFLPPPFSPSHPIFHHLAGIAETESQAMRAEAEQRIVAFIKAQELELEAKEKVVKDKVEALWKNFKNNLDRVQKERAPPPAQPHSRLTSHIMSNGVSSPAHISASLPVRNFIPQRISSSVQTRGPSIPVRVSALSASLASSKFHHPAYRGENAASSEESTPFGSPVQSMSSTLVHGTNPGTGSNVLQFNRVVDDNVNTQASYRYFMNLEEEMDRHKREREEAKKKQPVASASLPGQSGVAAAASKSSKAKPKENGDSGKPADSKPADTASTANGGEETLTRGREKGKRKVTFDVKLVADSEAIAEDDESEDDNDDDDALIFPLSDDEDEGPKATHKTAPKQSLPLLEAPPSRPLRERRINSGMETFTALRPSSLPAPSHIRPMRSQPGVDSSSPLVIKRPAKRVASRESAAASVPAPVSENRAAILKLVAADTPSHRGAWKPDSKAWQTFSRRRHDSDDETDVIPEEREDEETTARPTNIMGSKRSYRTYQMTSPPPAGMPGSMPVDIRMHAGREALSIASYRAPVVDALARTPSGAESSSVPGSSAAKRTPTSTSIRKAMYAERDRSRAMDPGFLDFPSDKDDEDEQENQEDAESGNADDGGERARKQALKILQARSEMPTESMWRSLA